MSSIAIALTHRSSGAVRFSDLLVLVYLLLPNLIFVLGWLRPEYGVPGAVLLIGAAAWMCRHVQFGAPVNMPRRNVAFVVLVIAFLWAWLSGIGHFLYANLDWVVRDAVLADLVRALWPVRYAGTDGTELLLRAPLGMYLPAAVGGAWVGSQWADLLLFFWCYAGIALVFYLIIREARNLREISIRLLLFVLFSGMDIVGAVIHGQLPGLGGHMEWWAGLFQYSSHTTQLFWVPNHALPGWMVIAWLVAREREREPLPAGFAIALVACVPLWSPLTALGLAPLVAAALLHRIYTAPRRVVALGAVLHPAGLVIAVVAMALIFPYLLLPGAPMPATLATAAVPGGMFWGRYVAFVILEFGLLGVLLLRRGPRDVLLWTALTVLLVLPLIRFGPYNDLAMRASIPALALVAIRLGDWFVSIWEGSRSNVEDAGASLAMLIFAIGALTPLQEIARTVLAPRWFSDPTRTVMMATGGRAPHYLAPADQGWSRRFLAPATAGGRTP